MTTDVAVTQAAKLNDFRGMLASMQRQLEMALPKHLTSDRLLRVALTAVQKNPKLLECTKRSVAGALMTAAQVGLEPDGTLGRAYLIPRQNRKEGTLECHFEPGYLGLLDLCQRSGEIASVRADVVRKGDKLVYKKGLEEELVHEEAHDNFDAPITHAYAIIRTKNGGKYWDIWPTEKIEAHRKRFSKDSREDSVWATDWPSMAKKTVLKAVTKLAPKTIEIAYAIAAMEREEVGLPMDVGDFAATVDGTTPATAPPKTIADLKDREKASAPASDAPPKEEPAKRENELNELIRRARVFENEDPEAFARLCDRVGINSGNLKSGGIAKVRPLVEAIEHVRQTGEFPPNLASALPAAAPPAAAGSTRDGLYEDAKRARLFLRDDLFIPLLTRFGGNLDASWYGLEVSNLLGLLAACKANGWAG